MSAVNNPIVFTDYHHSGLLNSLIMLFENRLDGKLYRPIGMEWYEQGYWNVYPHIETAKQYLSLDQRYRPIDGAAPLNQIQKQSEGIYYCDDIPSGKANKGVTLDTFWKLPVDIVIASIPEHIEPFKKLCDLHFNHPKLIFQVGNAFSVQSPTVKNVMASAKVDNVPSGVNLVEYHQEFPLDIFHFGEPNKSNNIYSFINCFNVNSIFQGDWQLFLVMEKLMSEWNFKSFGGQCRDGGLVGDQLMADRERESRFIWHTKWGGDGYGHIIFNSGAVGRPLVVKKEYYRSKLGEKLMTDGETCVTIDGLSPEEIKTKIEHYSEPTRYSRMCFKINDNFNNTVNFYDEEQKIRIFLEHLL